MTWLSRTLPVSAVVHMAAALPLFLFPVFSGDALPEPRREPLTVLEGPPMLVRARPVIAVRPGGGRRSRETSPPLAPVRETPALPANVVTDAGGPPVQDVLDDPGANPVIGEPGGGGTGVGLRMGEGPPGADGIGEGIGSPAGPLRPGGDLKAPRKLREVTPVYPELARQARVQGVVVLECVIDPSGHVAEVKVLQGHPLLESAAVNAVRQWLYTPTRLNGVPVAVLLTVTVRFE